MNSPNRPPEERRAGEREREGMARLAALVARLRAPDGCPWDREQELGDLRAYLLEEAHEVAAAIDAGEWPELAEELGDLLFQVVFVAVLAEESGGFDLDDVVRGIESKMIERHPHVFGGERLETAEEVRRAWERRKEGRRDDEASRLDGVVPTLPALTQAYRLTQRAAAVGFDWPGPRQVLAKLDEELGEVADELAAEAPRRAAVEAEVGDLLFAAANLARHLGFDPEAALAGANRRFRSRFAHVERRLGAAGRSLDEASLAEMDALWEEAKEREGEGR